MSVPLSTLRATKALAAKVARTLKGREILLLSGDLGTGKTTFVRYLAEALGINTGWVSSPSFTLVQRYPPSTGGFAVTHIDLYRVGRPEDLEGLGLDDILASDDLVIVEWPEAAGEIWNESRREIIRIDFRHDAAGKHEAALSWSRD